MGIFSRMKTLIKANVNDLASKAENPELVLKQLILDMEDQLRQAKIEVRDSITDKKRLKKKRDIALQKAQDWEKKAMMAVKANEDGLAREALSRKQEYDRQAEELQENWEIQNANVEKLKSSLKQLDSKIKEARSRKSQLVARMQRVETVNSMSTTGGAVGKNTAFESFERSAAKIDDFENSVEAEAELSDGLRAQELDTKFSGLEEEHGADDALAALKAKMGYDD